MAPENKLGITDSAEPARAEEKISKTKAPEIFEKGLSEQFAAGTFAGLSQIHKYLFDEIYDFAGTVPTATIAKGNFRFAPAMYLSSAPENISEMPQSGFDEIIAKYAEMNAAHPFREGNGRSTRIWPDAILKKEPGMAIDWSRADREDYLPAMERSPVNDAETKALLKAALTDKINDREVYVKGIDQSYCYEGRNLFKTENRNFEK